MQISKLMLGHHLMLEKLLNTFEKNLGKNFNLMSQSFDELKLGLEKHFLLEEQEIFKHYNSKRKSNLKAIERLVYEHDKMLDQINKIKNDLAVKDIIDLSEFKKELLKHRYFEEDYFYPRLEKEMTDREKRKIIEKLVK